MSMKLLFGSFLAGLLLAAAGCGGNGTGKGDSGDLTGALADNTYIAETGFPPQNKTTGPVNTLTMHDDGTVTVMCGQSTGPFPQPEFIVNGKLESGGVFTGSILVNGSIITQAKASYQLEGGALTLYLSDISVTPGWIFLRALVPSP